MGDEDRRLTDTDIELIVDRLEKRLMDNFYSGLGKGVWAWIKKAVIGLLLALALYGMVHDKDFFKGLF
jgi:hypothetical protein